MTRTGRRTIVLLAPNGTVNYNEDGAAGEVITPGMLVQGVATVLKHATAGGEAARNFATELSYMGKTIDSTYAVGDTVCVAELSVGDHVYAMLASGQNIAADTFLESAGGGTLRAYAAGVRLARALEAVNNTTGGSPRIRAQIV